MTTAMIWCLCATQAQPSSHEYTVWYEAKGRPTRVQLYQFDPDGSRLFAAHPMDTDKVEIWSVGKKQVVSALDWGNNPFFRGGVTVAALSSNQRHFVAGTSGGLAIWDLSTSQREWHKMPTSVFALAFQKDSDQFVTGIGSIITVWKLNSIAAETSHRCQSDVFSVNYSSDSQRIVVGHEDGGISVYDANTLIPENRRWKFHRQSVLDAFFVEQDRKILSIGHEGDVVLTEVQTGKRSKLIADKDGVASVAYARKTNWLVLGSYGGTVSVVDVTTGKVIFKEEFREAVVSVAISEDGSVLAAATGSEQDDVARESKNAVMKWWKLKK